MNELERIRAVVAEWKRWEAEYEAAETGSWGERMAYDPLTSAEVELLDILLPDMLDKLLAVASAAAEYMRHDKRDLYIRVISYDVWECKYCGRASVELTEFPHMPDCPLAALETALAALTNEAAPES